MAEPVAAAHHLDQLAAALREAGWGTRRRHGQGTELLQVFSTDLPGVGESIRVGTGIGGLPCFISSTGDPMAHCHDLHGARMEVAIRLSRLGISVDLQQRPQTA
ncbi:hypothetical protein [Actinomadura rubrisoli]|uniref:Uncharacterized protein n=1 Tax=Actinomadura rubrisoli TaxID=2530368 RepID=A0A4R5CFF5_9ACTN|nr:hypothetical protein [Actinomadura rubrisoli]TDD97130.1 hypothetical protein E1298_01440 [Actinomadura rubrisoli]